ncbi:MAG: PepSY-associated TM helix domain-containing protein [Limisphaerales bacterium]
MPRQAGHSLSFWGHDAQGRSFHAFFNPHTGALLGHDVAGGNLTEWLYELHANLLGGRTGQQVNGVGGLLCVVLLLTGVAVWWPGRGQVVRQGLTIRWRARWKRLNYDLHKVVGIASAALLFLVAVTGVWFPFQAPFRWAAEKLTGTSAQENSPAAAVPAPDAQRLPLDDAVRAADAVLPGVPANWIGLPEKPGDVLTVRKRLPGEWRLEGMNHVHLEPYTGTVVRADLHAERTPAQRILRAMFPLHAGTFGGLTTRILWVILGLAPALLFVTGFLMWWNRVVRPPRRAARAAS